MTSHQILTMDTGPMMDELITKIVKEIDPEITHKPWSTDRLAALELRDFIVSIGCDINLTKFGMGPRDLEEYCQIRDESESFVATSADNMPEAISRAFLLYHNRFFGEHVNAKYVSAMNQMKCRPAKIYPFPKS